MRIHTALLAAAIAILPALAMAQTAAPVDAPPAAAASPSVTPDKAHHGGHHKRRAEARAKYQQLSATDKAKFDDLTKQMKQLHQQRMQILGLAKS